MIIAKNLHFIGYACGLGGKFSSSADGPLVLQKSRYLENLSHKGIHMTWEEMLIPDLSHSSSRFDLIAAQCNALARLTAQLVQQKKFFITLGGDHSCAIGSWSGAAAAKKSAGPIGLIWIDAHMDSHTPETSLSGNIHGMPLATLLGYGHPLLTHLLHKDPKLLPQNICLIGVRSFEAGEAELLERLRVRIFYMKEIQQRGLKAVFMDAIKMVTQNTVGYGISIDIDSMDPKEAPGTGVAEPNGISAADLCQSLSLLKGEPRLIGAEIVEFDPHFDEGERTEKLIPRLIEAMI